MVRAPRRAGVRLLTWHCLDEASRWSGLRALLMYSLETSDAVS